MSQGNSSQHSTAAADRAAVFSLRDVRKDYHVDGHVVRVLKGIDLDIAQGEWTALVGCSGSGKTTLLHLLGALDIPSGGSVSFHGRDYTKLSGRAKAMLRRREIGYVFQSYHLMPELTAWENVQLPALLWRSNRHSVRRRAAELLRAFGLGHRLEHRPQELSGGEQQRVALARALIHEPRAILADEPTGNLDAAATADIVRILERLHRDEGKTIVMVTHDKDLAASADRIFELQDGQALPGTGAARSELQAPPPCR